MSGRRHFKCRNDFTITMKVLKKQWGFDVPKWRIFFHLSNEFGFLLIMFLFIYSTINFPFFNNPIKTFLLFVVWLMSCMHNLLLEFRPPVDLWRALHTLGKFLGVTVFSRHFLHTFFSKWYLVWVIVTGIAVRSTYRFYHC